MHRLRHLALSLVSVGVLAGSANAQIHRLAELDTTQIAALDRARTVVILTGGIMEQHGPFLPSFADGYGNEYAAQRLAEAIVARPGWRVLMFPTIPLGSGGANEIGRKHVFPGTYTVRSTTLRAVFMDLATEFGEQGFIWIFVVHGHGAPSHNRALDQAGDYFRDTYGGRMVHHMGLIPPGATGAPTTLTEAEQKEDGFTVHAGAAETSAVMFLRPDLVRPVAQAQPHTADGWESLVRVAKAPGWPGYFGSPRLATAAHGARSTTAYVELQADYALRILDGADERRALRFGAMAAGNPTNVGIDTDALAREAAIDAKQQAWLQAHAAR